MYLSLSRSRLHRLSDGSIDVTLGEIIESDSGDYFPIDLSTRVRIRQLGDRFEAYNAQGMTYVFGGEAQETTARGTYKWCLTSVRTFEGDRTEISYEKNASGKIFMSSSATEDANRFNILFNLTTRTSIALQLPAISQAKGVNDRRLSTIDFFVKTNRTLDAPTFKEDDRYSRRWQIRIGYKYSDQSHVFHLYSVQKFYNDGKFEPQITFEHHEQSDFLKQTRRNHSEESVRLCRVFVTRVSCEVCSLCGSQ